MSKPKIKKPYAAINMYTGAVSKRFKTLKKLVKFLFKKKSTILGTFQPYELGSRPYLIVKETDDSLEISPIEFVAE